MCLIATYLVAEVLGDVGIAPVLEPALSELHDVPFVHNRHALSLLQIREREADQRTRKKSFSSCLIKTCQNPRGGSFSTMEECSFLPSFLTLPRAYSTALLIRRWVPSSEMGLMPKEVVLGKRTFFATFFCSRNL